MLAITTVPVKIKQAPHSALADQLVAFLLSDKVEAIMAKSEAAHIPVNEDVDGPEAFGDQVKNVKWMEYDKAAVVERMKTMSRAVDLWVSEQQ